MKILAQARNLPDGITVHLQETDLTYILRHDLKLFYRTENGDVSVNMDEIERKGKHVLLINVHRESLVVSENRELGWEPKNMAVLADYLNNIFSKQRRADAEINLFETLVSRMSDILEAAAQEKRKEPTSSCSAS